MPTGFAMPCSEKGLLCAFRPGEAEKSPPYDKELYKQRHKIEIMFGRLEDWRKIAMSYDRCVRAFFSATCIAATVIFYL